MKNFWPNRSIAKGFSIENLASKYREKISSSPYINNSNQFLDDKNLKSIKDNSEEISVAELFIKRDHWANRDFSEYKEAA